MTSFNIITPPGTIHIELLDNPFVKKWIKHFCNMQKAYDVDYHAETQPVYHSNKTTQEILKDLKNLRDTIIKLQDMGTNFPFKPWDIAYEKVFMDHDVGQKLLNEVHRYFTTAGKSLDRWSDDFDSEFTVNKNDKEQFEHCHALINDYVHEVDQSIMTARKSTDFNKQIVNLQFSFNNQEMDCRFDKGSYVYIKEKDYQYASDSKEYDVWVGPDILGKDYIDAYYDHDDPSQWDVTSINGYTGRFNINVASQWYEKESVDNTIQKLVKTDDFQNWLKEYNVKYVPQMCGIPLGKVTNGKEFVIRKYFKSVHKQDFKIVVNN